MVRSTWTHGHVAEVLCLSIHCQVTPATCYSPLNIAPTHSHYRITR